MQVPIHGARRHTPLMNKTTSTTLARSEVTIAATELVHSVEKVFERPESQADIEAMEDDVRRAKSYAGEVCHLRGFMNHEKN